MANSSTPPSGGMLTDMQSSMNLLQIWSRSAALPIELFVRQFGTWGPKYLGIGALFGLVWPVAFMLFYQPHPQLNWVVRFWYVMIAMLLVHRFAGLIRRHRGYQPHSFYIGHSWFQLFKGWEEPKRARTVEVIVAAAVSLFLFLVLKPLGAFLLLGTAAHVFNLIVIEMSMTARLRALRDAQIENECVMARYRELQNQQSS
jgi:hypothetical protein